MAIEYEKKYGYQNKQQIAIGVRKYRVGNDNTDSGNADCCDYAHQKSGLAAANMA